MSAGTLINTSNLHVGGGVQVAVSVLSEISAGPGRRPVSIVLSSEVEGGLKDAERLVAVCDQVLRLDVRGFKLLDGQYRRVLDRFARVFTLYGPLYRWNPPFFSIVGFAQPWIIYPRNEVYARLPWHQRLRTRLKFRLQAAFFKRADLLVVELEHVKAGLVRELAIAPERIVVVHNCVSSLYANPASWEPLEMPEAGDVLRLGFLGRNYVHKNTAIFPQIVEALRGRHGIEARVFVTFTDEEWRAAGPEFRAACINVGPLRAAQCPSFYQGLDAVVFPSLLECFSATPLEAMAMERPLFASDRPFNRDICGSHANYFDPLSAESAADEIARVFKADGPDPAALSAASRHAFSFASPSIRAEQYLALLEQADTKKK